MTNQITVTGNLAADAELRFTPNGAAVANFTVCDTPRKFDKQTQEWTDNGDTLYLRCSVWREWAEWAGEHLHRGDRVTVTGRLKQRNWDDQEGNKRSVVEADVDSISVHPRAQRSQGAQRPQQGGDPWGQQPGHGGGFPSSSDGSEPPFSR